MGNFKKKPAEVRIAIDIGSTIIKIAMLSDSRSLMSQSFFPRDMDMSISSQLNALMEQLGIDDGDDDIAVCSSANGGLRVGIVCLTHHFSGAALRNEVLLAGANPVFVHALDEALGDARRVDILLVGGGIDCVDAAPMSLRLGAFDPCRYNYGALLYAANRYLAADFQRRFPNAVVIGNPLRDRLTSRVGSVFESIRRAYLDDLIFKEGVSNLRGNLSRTIRPTPEVVSRGFLRAVQSKSDFHIVGPCIALDVGGATTDLHYTVELVSEESAVRPASGVSIARHVFTDLGIVASRDTVHAQLRAHPRLYEFLAALPGHDAREAYSSLREGEYQAPPATLSYACLFLALDRFSRGHGPGLPCADLGLLSQVILTGGAVQSLSIDVVSNLLSILMPHGTPPPLVQVDTQYQIWVGGITWEESERVEPEPEPRTDALLVECCRSAVS